MAAMKIKCDFCDATAVGTRDKLQMSGWVRAIFSSPKRLTISACPVHHREWSERVQEIFASASVGGTTTKHFEATDQ
jgi:hypothetical protein